MEAGPALEGHEAREEALLAAPLPAGANHHPELWKTAKTIMIPKQSMPGYSQDRAYRVISRWTPSASTAAHLIVDHLERRRGLHEG